MYQIRQFRKVGTLAETRLSNVRIPLKNRLEGMTKIPNKKELLDGSKNPVLALQNAIQIGSPLDIYKLYGVVHHSSLVKELEERDVFDIAMRAGNDRMSFLGGLRAFEFAKKVVDDYRGLGKTPSLEMELAVLRAGKSVAYNSLHIIIAHAQKLLESPVCEAEGAKEKVLNVLFGCKFEISQYEWLFAQMVEKGMDVGEAFLGMMKAYAVYGDVVKAESIYNQMKVQGLKTSTDQLLALAQGFALQGDIPQTKKYVDLLPKDSFVQQQGLKFLAQCYAERGLQSDAIQVYKEYRRQGFPSNAYLYEQMIKACISTVDTKGVLKFFHKSNGFKSMGMYTQLVKGLLAADSSVTAWKTVREALVEYTNRNQTKRVHVPSELAQALVHDIKDKHIDYFKDRIKLVNLPLHHRSQLISKMIYYSPPELAQVLYKQFEKGVCELAQTPVQATLNYMHVLAQAKEPKKVQELFDLSIDTSYSREMDLYTVLMQSKETPDEIKAVYDDMIKHKLEVNGDMVEPLIKGLGKEAVLEIVTRNKIPVRKGVLETNLIPLDF